MQYALQIFPSWTKNSNLTRPNGWIYSPLLRQLRRSRHNLGCVDRGKVLLIIYFNNHLLSWNQMRPSTLNSHHIELYALTKQPFGIQRNNNWQSGIECSRTWIYVLPCVYWVGGTAYCDKIPVLLLT